MLSAAAAASKATAHYLQFRIQWASIVLLYYDYALTFPSEVKYVWGKRVRFSTILYICCRYALIANVLYLIAIAKKIPSLGRYAYRYWVIEELLRHVSCSCDSWYKFDGVISVLGRAAVISTLTGRTYAVFGCNRLILAVLGSLGLTCIILDIMHVPGLNCIGGTTDTLGLYNLLSPRVEGLLLTFHIVPHTEAGLLAVLMCVFEFLAAALTIGRCIQECRVGGSWKFERGGFFTLVSKQGLYYYCIVSIFTTAAVVLSFRAPTGSFFQRIPNAMNLPVSCLLTARFLLQLREWQETDSVSAATSANMNFGTETGHILTLSALRAAAVVDAALLDDFGDYYSSTQSSWQAESTRANGDDANWENENGDGQIALDNLRATGEGSGRNESAEKV